MQPRKVVGLHRLSNNRHTGKTISIRCIATGTQFWAQGALTSCTPDRRSKHLFLFCGGQTHLGADFPFRQLGHSPCGRDRTNNSSPWALSSVIACPGWFRDIRIRKKRAFHTYEDRRVKHHHENLYYTLLGEKGRQ